MMSDNFTILSEEGTRLPCPCLVLMSPLMKSMKTRDTEGKKEGQVQVLFKENVVRSFVGSFFVRKAPAKSATVQKLNNLGVSISRQKAPQIPQGVRLPPGISLSAPGSSSKRSSSSGGASNGESSRKRVSVDHNVASALNTGTSPAGGSEPRQKVELELNSKQMNALKTLGLL